MWGAGGVVVSEFSGAWGKREGGGRRERVMSLVMSKQCLHFLHEQRRCCYLACEKSCSF